MRYPLLDVVRGLAALWVFAFHYPRWDELNDWLPFAWQLMKHGELGVPLFFVVSGYCMMASARSAVRHEESTPSYLKRRLVRIYPPFWCSVLVVLALPWTMEAVSAANTGMFQRPLLEYAQLDFTGWLAHLSMLQIFATGFDRIVDKFSALNSVYWTLAIEVQFYLVITVGLLRSRWLLPILALTTVAGLLCAFSPELYLTGLFLPYWPMFAMGIGLYLAFERGWEPKGRAAILAGVAVVLGVLAVIGLDLADLHAQVFAASATIALWLLRPLDVWFTKELGPLAGRLRALLLVLGAMSYSLYLLHAELMRLVLMFVRQVTTQAGLPGMALTIVVTTALCYPFYLLCERPFHRAARRATAKPEA